jgi:hypothetical protein
MARCCKICQKQNEKTLYQSHIYSREGKSYELILCREHDIEFFKIGQIRFMAKYCFKNSDDADAPKDEAPAPKEETKAS